MVPGANAICWVVSAGVNLLYSPEGPGTSGDGPGFGKVGGKPAVILSKGHVISSSCTPIPYIPKSLPFFFWFTRCLPHLQL